MKPSKISTAGILAAVLLAAPLGLRAQNATPSPAPAPAQAVSPTDDEKATKLLVTARAQYLHGDYAAAQETFAAVLAIDPGNGEAKDYVTKIKQLAASQPAPANASVLIELTEAGAGTPTVIEIPRALLANLPAAVVGATAETGGGSPTNSAIAAIALSAALTLGGLHFFRQKRALKAPAAILSIIGLLALTASLVHGDVSPPSLRHSPLVAGHVVIKVVEEGNAVHIVASRELLTALLRQPPVKEQK